ncbi:PREDICTED: putative nuclease HARBI1 [Wasmannia auropunctata]|uniref:putative nuclease HARBI1 n=1 Tax=Wasmannia auropunctata TaxID=64793 RepID=UPI0005F034F1|nr:PREDICTED: putative nuclease HARBI1 [Wasmannia auropunctata]
MDEKHCVIDPPLQSGSMYYNYKGNYSVVLLALVDAQLRFIYVDVGTNGRVSDSGVWNKCSFKNHLDKDTLHIPPPAPLPGTQDNFPFVIIGDEGFTLSEKLLIPYLRPQCSGNIRRSIFNYRLSRARRCSENAFGVMAARFQIFRSAMRYDPDDASKIILSVCCLHNMLRSQSVGRLMYTPPSFLDGEDEISGQIRHGEWRSESAGGMINLTHQGGNRHPNQAIALTIRDKWCDYFNTVGAVSWQERMVRMQ